MAITICPSCKKPMSDSLDKCIFCGKPITKKVTSTSSTKATAKNTLSKLADKLSFGPEDPVTKNKK